MASERIEDALGAFVRSKQKGADSGNYQRKQRVLREWISWLDDREERVESFDQLDVSHMRQYARHLKERVDDRPEVRRSKTGEQGALFRSVGKDQRTLAGEKATGRSLF